MPTLASTMNEPLLPNNGSNESVEGTTRSVTHDHRHRRCHCLTSLFCCKRKIQPNDDNIGNEEEEEEGGEESPIPILSNNQATENGDHDIIQSHDKNDVNNGEEEGEEESHSQTNDNDDHDNIQPPDNDGDNDNGEEEEGEEEEKQEEEEGEEETSVPILSRSHTTDTHDHNNIQSRDDDNDDGEEECEDTSSPILLHSQTSNNDDHKSIESDTSNQLSLHERIVELQQCMKRVLEHPSNDLELSSDFITMLLQEDDDGGKEEEEEKEKEMRKEENDDIVGEDEAIEDECVERTERMESIEQNEQDEHYYKNHYTEQIFAKSDVDGDADGDDGNNDFSYHILKGVPCRPFYKSLSMRIVLFTHLCHSNSNHDMIQTNEDGNEAQTEIDFFKISRPLIDASKLGFTENQPLPVIAPFTTSTTATNVINYMNKLQENGIFEYLGLRSTIGTITTASNSSDNGNESGGSSVKINHHEYLNHIPSIEQLLQAANQPCKPKSNPPRLTLAGRARAKHAHRSISVADEDLYFGICKGPTKEKNDAADVIVRAMIRDAIWMNIHIVGGVDVPILEIRVKEGYGARWSVKYSCSQTSDNDGGSIDHKMQRDVIFRGFLEPHMSDGFEKKWRH